MQVLAFSIILLLHSPFNVQGLVYSNQIPERGHTYDVLNKNRARLCINILIAPDVVVGVFF